MASAPLPPTAPQTHPEQRQSPRGDGRGYAPLPYALTPLIGREDELERARALLHRPAVRLLTMVGPGGIGKTHLALEFARGIMPAFGDGVRFVQLDAIPTTDGVAAAVARGLGIQETVGMPAADALQIALRDVETLLVLDPLEHVLDAATFVAGLLSACPRVKLLATSRAPLGVPGEQTLPVPPLGLPAVDEPATSELIERSAAVRLFVARVRAVQAGFALTDATAPMVAAICRHLDGLPLAIELAAAQSTVLPPAALLARITERLPLPVAAPRNAPDRQRTVHNAVAWSYDLLTKEEQTLFRRLGVFVGGFTVAAAEHVHRAPSALPRSSGAPLPEPQPATHDLLSSLVHKSLVRRDAGADDGRFSMLETIRTFALAQLDAEQERDAAGDVHADWCLDLAQGSQLLWLRPDGARALLDLEVEHGNLRAALTWLERRGDHPRLLALAAAMGGFWYAHSHYREGCAWLERALARGQDGPENSRTWALIGLARLLTFRGEIERMERLDAEAPQISREAGDPLVLAMVFNRKGWIAIQRGAYDRAEHVLTEALAEAEAVEDPVVSASMTAMVLANLGLAAHGRGDFALARARHERALATCRAHGYDLGVVRSLRDLGDVARDQGDYAGSAAFYRDCLALLGEQGDLRVVVDALEGSALAAAAWNQPERAAMLLGAAEALRERCGAALVLATDRAAHERALAVVRAGLGEQGLRTAWEAGRALSVSGAMAEVREVSPPATAAAGIGHASVQLSAREAEVLRLLAAGKPDREIADALFLSVRTVERHVARIFAKLGVRTRAAAVSAAIAAGLV